MTETAAPLISLQQASMQFDGQQVLHAVDLNVHRGQTVCVIGESGCGKTVLLKLMIGLLRPTVGRALFDGKVLTDMTERELTKQRRRFGFLFQGAALFDSLTVFDNVAFGLHALGGKTEAAIREIVQQRLAEVGMAASAMAKKPAELSGGMKKRVGLARALALDPEVMLYDEPTTGLDPIMTDVINELILQTQRTKKATGVVVTHEMKTVAKVADRVVMLFPLARLQPDEPQMIYDGPPQGLEEYADKRVRQFVRGEAGERLRELSQGRE
jgi:phospholipid/cholesterol/gamma-HCH transport system ATP-binding protein